MSDKQPLELKVHASKQKSEYQWSADTDNADQLSHGQFPERRLTQLLITSINDKRFVS